LRISFFFTNPLTVFGGFEKILGIVINYLEKKGIETILCKLIGEKEQIPDRSAWIELYRHHPRLFVVKYSWPFFLTERSARWIGEIRISENHEFFENLRDVDVAIVNYPFLLKPIYSLLQRIGSKSKIVGWFHDWLYAGSTRFKREVKKVLVPFLIPSHLKSADLVLAISSGIAEKIEKFSPRTPVSIVYNPVLTDDYEKIPPVKRSNRPIFAYVGRLVNPNKNLKFMFKGLSMLEYDWKLKIIGEGPDEDMLKEYSKKLGIQDRIEWLGFSKEPYELLRDEGVTALLLTSNFEGLGLVLIEAISYGIPVISSDCETGPRDIVVEGVNGYLYKPGDLRDFVEKVNGLVTGKLKVASPEEMRKTVKKFQIDVVCEKIYDELVKLVEKT